MIRLIIRCILFSLTIVALSCTSNQRITSLPSAKEQCEVLGKKRATSSHINRRLKFSRNSSARIETRVMKDLAISQNTDQLALTIFPERLPPNTLMVDASENSVALCEATLINHKRSTGDVSSLIYPNKQTVATRSERNIGNTEPAAPTPNQQKYDVHGWTIVPLMFGISFVVAAGLLFAFRTKLMRLSAWAAVHPVKTRSIIAVAHMVSAGIYFYAGHELGREGIAIPLLVPYLSAGLLGIGFLFYPANSISLENFTRNYILRKIGDIGLIAAGAMLMMHAGNHHAITFTPPAASQETVLTIPARIAGGDNIRIVKVDPVKTFTPGDQQDPKPKRNAGKKFLIIFFSVLLMMGVAALSCAIACSGAGALAIVVLVLGQTGIVLLMISLWRKLNGTQRRQRKKNIQPAT